MEEKKTVIEQVTNKDTEIFEVKRELQELKEKINILIAKDTAVHNKIESIDTEIDSELDEEGDSEWIY